MSVYSVNEKIAQTESASISLHAYCKAFPMVEISPPAPSFRVCSLKILKSNNCYKINILSNSYPSFKTTRNSHVCEVCACVYICVCTPMCLFVEAGGCMFVCAHLCACLWRLEVDHLPSSPLSVLVLEFLLWIWNLLFQRVWHFIHWAVSLAPRLVFGCAFGCSNNHATEACVNCSVVEAGLWDGGKLLNLC